jgi:toxin secretion/phage lysis holin
MRDVTIDLVWNKAQIFITTLGGFLGWYLGGNDGLLVTLVVFACIDYVTGVMCAVSDRALSSAVGSRGIFRKMMIFALVGIGHIVDSQVIGTGSALRSAVICFYLSNEGVSIIENAAHLGLPIPNKLKAALEQLHNRDGQNTGGE